MQADLRLLDDEQRALVQMVREFGAAEAAPAAIEYEARAEDPVPLYRKLAELGLKSWAERRWLDVPALEF
jgi:alkylation response protein AidB-like acyl-CoA dehydrogenase